MKRVHYIDILRAWAVLLMVFWHLTDALILNSIRKSDPFYVTQFVGGLVAPMFLFAAGFASAILILKKRDSFISFTTYDFRKRMINILIILIVAYLLHLPERNTFSVILSRSGEAYLHFVKTDVLQTIATGMLALHIIFLFIKNIKMYFYFVLITGILFIVLTPYVWLIDFGKYLPVEIATYFTPAYYSLFPIFPWFGYLFLGAVLQLMIENQDGDKGDKVLLEKIVVSGVVMIVLGLSTHLAGIKTSVNYNFWVTSMNIFMIKLGIVFILIYLFSVLNEKLNYDMKIFKPFSTESLFVYVTHLLIIYGGNAHTMQTIFGRTFNWLQLVVMYFVMIFALLFAAKGWSKLKEICRAKFSKV